MLNNNFARNAFARNKDKLFHELFMAGYDDISDFVGYDYPAEEDKDVTETRMEAAFEHLTDNELFEFFKKYDLMYRFIGMIAGRYVRDAQIYNHSVVPEDYSYSEDCEDYWSDASDSALVVWDGEAVDAEEVKERLCNLYTCPDDAFIILQVAD